MIGQVAVGALLLIPAAIFIGLPIWGLQAGASYIRDWFSRRSPAHRT
jgi:hypothetical protein